MQDEVLRAQARSAGIEPVWEDVSGRTHEVSVEALRAVLAALGPGDETATNPTLVTAEAGAIISVAGVAGPYRLHFEDGSTRDGVTESAADGVRLAPVHEPGYYRLEFKNREIALAVAPSSCWTIADATAGRRSWGLTVQLYGLRRAEDGGIGDFTALETLMRHAGEAGAAALAISPVHAQFSADPGRFSPYSPSSRLMLNALHADPRLASLPEALAREENEFVNWPIAAAWRIEAFRRAFKTAVTEAGPQIREFEEFRRSEGELLECHARFEALHAFHLAVNAADWDWRAWPTEMRDPHSDAVQRFAAANSEEVAFHAYLQFLAHAGLGAAQRAALGAGMPIGIIADIAVGVSPGGSDAWSRQSEMLNGLTIGAPPDLFNPRGQDWGVTSSSPGGLAANGYRMFIDMLRASLRHAGGLRLDHVMGLARLWVVPQGGAAADGAYLRYPVEDLLRLVKLESWRHRAIVLGEDLGTLPDGFRDRLEANGLAGMRVLWFERDGARFVPPREWTPSAVAMTSTHDLPTVAGWWVERDIDWRDKLALPNAEAERRVRAGDRRELWAAFRESGAAAGDAPPAWDTRPVVDAACAQIGGAACGLALLPLEDALALPEQPNLPGTIDEHPNWRRRLLPDVENMLADPGVAARLRTMAGRRE